MYQFINVTVYNQTIHCRIAALINWYIINTKSNEQKIQLLSIIFLGVSSVAFSQIKEEKLILNKKREPEVKKIEKENFGRNH
jgi:hypothetical protein